MTGRKRLGRILERSRGLLASGVVAASLVAGTAHADHGVVQATEHPPHPHGTVAAQIIEPVAVAIQLFTYREAMIQVPVGTTVTWTNQDAIEHSATAGEQAVPSGAFDSGLFLQGESFSFTFDAPGVYSYFCSRHPSMQGVVEVTGP